MKKCLVLDLDNTLWGGIVGEDGMEKLQLGLTPPGNSFLAFQQAILDLHDRGIILAINSRNNEADALRVITTHPNMVLKERHFAARRINWDSKVDNLRSLAQELNIGLDSMVFLDDDPTNRAMVRAYIPEVEVPELPGDPTQYAKFLLSLPYFETNVITDEDKMRGNYYVTERLRKEEEQHAGSPEQFLQSLNLEVHIRRNDDGAVPRLSQLTEKTNQFNIHKRPLTEEDVRSYMRSDTHDIYHMRAIDRFGDYGIIAFALVSKKASVWHIESLLMSCRIIGRGVEDALLHVLGTTAARHGANSLTIDFVKSEKNAPAEQFVQRHFSGGQLGLDVVPPPPSWITISYENI